MSTGIGDMSAGFAVIESSDGRIVVGGTGRPSVTLKRALFAYTPAGQLDGSFGAGGTLILDPGPEGGNVRQLLQTGKGELLALGGTIEEDGSLLRVARISPTGTVDPTFDIREASRSGRAAILDRRGRLVVGGGVSDADPNAFVARYLADGSADLSFNGEGVIEINFALDSIDSLTGLVELQDGKLLVVGFAEGDGKAPLLARSRHNSNGSLDFTFGERGTIVTAAPFVSSPALISNTAVVDGGDRTILAGRSQTSPFPLAAVARMLPDGTLDTTFGDSGVSAIDFSAEGDPSTTASAVAIDPDGRILVCAYIGPADRRVLGVARLWP